MSAHLRFNLDPTNPGQFFACCGLLELAARLWPSGVTGAFQEGGRVFVLDAPKLSGEDSAQRLTRSIASCSVTNTLSSTECQRLEELRAKKKAVDAELEQEKAALESRRREAPVVFGEPFWIMIDWHQDDRSGG